MSQLPRYLLVISSSVASPSIPYPKDKYLNLFPVKFIYSASLATSLKGSAPGLNMNIMGDFSVL